MGVANFKLDCKSCPSPTLRGSWLSPMPLTTTRDIIVNPKTDTNSFAASPHQRKAMPVFSYCLFGTFFPSPLWGSWLSPMPLTTTRKARPCPRLSAYICSVCFKFCTLPAYQQHQWRKRMMPTTLPVFLCAALSTPQCCGSVKQAVQKDLPVQRFRCACCHAVLLCHDRVLLHPLQHGLRCQARCLPALIASCPS